MDLHFGALAPQGWKGELDGMDATTAWQTMISTAVEVERLGYDSVWLYDHFHSVPAPARPTPVFECWSAMTAIAAETRTIRIGQMVTCAPYRNPAYLAKIAACVDVASGGRLEMGLGAGWYQPEFEAYGYPFPGAGARVGYLADTAEIVKAMWRDTPATYDGRYASIRDAFCEPKPLQRPRPPLWIGGGGERKTLRVVAEHADWANWGGSVDNFRHKARVLAEHCEDAGRDPDEIAMTLHCDALVARDERDLRNLLDEYPSIWGQPEQDRLPNHLIGTPQQVVDRIGAYVDAGARGFVMWFPDYPRTDSLARFAETVIPAL